LEKKLDVTNTLLAQERIEHQANAKSTQDTNQELSTRVKIAQEDLTQALEKISSLEVAIS
jgi:hypothetical protein